VTVFFIIDYSSHFCLLLGNGPSGLSSYQNLFLWVEVPEACNGNFLFLLNGNPRGRWGMDFQLTAQRQFFVLFHGIKIL
jgi:hypothetical protein